MQKKLLKRLLIPVLIISSVILAPISAIKSWASSELIDTTKKTTLNISHTNSNKPVIGAKFNLYKVGDMSTKGDFTLSKDYSKYDIDIDGVKEQSKWDEIADTLATYTQADNIKATKIDTTNDSGNVSFRDLEVGLYLVVGERATQNGKYIDTKPFMVSLPSKDLSTGAYTYDVSATTKSNEIVEIYSDLKVEKVWINDENYKDKPTSIEVELYKNNKLVDSVILNESNKWQYVWKNLDNQYTWVVKEKNVPKDYTVSYEKYTTYIKIKNTYVKSVKPPTGLLPQTGTPLRMAQVLSLVGLVLISTGYVLNRKNG